MMGINQPDVTFSEHALAGSPERLASAVPLFIGYGQRGTAYALSPVNSMADYEATFGGVSATGGQLYYTVKHYFDNGGSGGFVLSLGLDSTLPLTADQLIAAFSDTRIATAVMQETTLTLAAIPDMALLDDADADHWAQAWQALLNICQARRGVFGLLDTPDTAANARACVTQFLQNSPASPEWAAAYWPRLVTPYGADTAHPVVVPPCGALAAVMETTDRQYGVWKAPANVALAQVVKPSQSWLQSSGLFQPEGASLNLIRSFPGRGTRVWGCRTLTPETTSPWRYVQVRRFLAYVEAELSLIGQHFVFEPNNPLTWIKFRGLAHILLRQLWLEGALYGAEEQQAFYIQIGLNETMTEADIVNGKMIMQVGVAVAYPAEFVAISLAFDTRMGMVQSVNNASLGGTL